MTHGATLPRGRKSNPAKVLLTVQSIAMKEPHMTKTTTIILDRDAVNALFPEGSEVRVKLQDTVLGLLAKQFVAAYTSQSPEMVRLRGMMDATYREALQEQGILNRFGHVELGARLKQDIQSAAAQQVVNALGDTITAKIEECKPQIMERVQPAMDKLTSRWLEAEVNRRVLEVAANLGKMSQ